MIIQFLENDHKVSSAAIGIPIAVPVSCQQYSLPNWKAFDLSTIRMKFLLKVDRMDLFFLSSLFFNIGHCTYIIDARIKKAIVVVVTRKLFPGFVLIDESSKKIDSVLVIKIYSGILSNNQKALTGYMCRN